MPVYGFRFGDFIYITDANRIEEGEKNKMRDSKVLVLNALRKETHISHFTLSEAIGMVEELNVTQGYFTHISHQLGLHDEVSSTLPKNVFLAHDGLKLNI
jgi:phosphoribosyl 1,2-cyclic phosphate phosphodiesterase